MIQSYPKVYTIGHKLIRSLFDGPVVVQEKVDGSQFSFGVRDGRLICRSRGAELCNTDTFPMHVKDKLFQGPVETAYLLYSAGKLVEGWTYRGEAVSRPKHNTLEYYRAPKGFIILFDVDTGLEERSLDTLIQAASDLDLEMVPTIHTGEIDNPDSVRELLGRESILGGCAIEGVVVKNYNRFNDMDGKMLMGKYVSEAFKEKHKVDWKVSNPGKGDQIEKIIKALRTDARWEKAVQRRRDVGLLQEMPQDIGPMIADLMDDTATEERDWIKDQLYAAFEKQILRGVTNGFAQWYKDRLLSLQFPDAKCLSLPDGSCVAEGECMHTPNPEPTDSE